MAGRPMVRATSVSSVSTTFYARVLRRVGAQYLSGVASVVRRGQVGVRAAGACVGQFDGLRRHAPTTCVRVHAGAQERFQVANHVFVRL
jgi:hypothetical protein